MPPRGGRFEPPAYDHDANRIYYAAEFPDDGANAMTEAKPKPKLNLKGWWWKLPIVLIGLFFLAGGLANLSGPAGLPSCASTNARETLKTAFDGSQFARSLNLSMIDMGKPVEISYDEPRMVRVCRTQVALNNTEKTDVTFTLEGRRDGKYMLTFEAQ